MQVTGTIKYVGVNDHDIDLFEGQYDVRENGMAYNSYVVIGEKVAVADTVDARFVDEWLGNVETALDGRMPDYLVVHHMEPDHSAGIVAFMDRYPDAQIVASKMAFKMMAAYFGTDFSDRQIVCKEGFELDLGGRTLRFIGAANVHWPEVMFSYDSQDKVLFSADAFGKFGVAVSERLRRLRERRAAVSAEKRKKLLSFAGRKNGGKLLLCEGKTFVFTIRIVHIPPPERSSCVFYAGAGER